MPVFVKAHKRGRSLVKAYNRNVHVGLTKDMHGLPFGRNLKRQDRLTEGIANKIGMGNRILKRPSASSYMRVMGRLSMKSSRLYRMAGRF